MQHKRCNVWQRLQHKRCNLVQASRPERSVAALQEATLGAEREEKGEKGRPFGFCRPREKALFHRIRAPMWKP